MQNKEWRNDAYLSLGGVHDKKDSLPQSLKRFLNKNSQVIDISLHLDNDEVGIKARNNLLELLKDKYNVVSETSSYGKDINDELQHLIKVKRREIER